MMQIAHLDELLQIVGNVRAEIIAARAQLAGRQLAAVDVEQQERLHAVDVRAVAAVEFVLDHVEQPAMQPLDQRKRLEIKRLQPRLVRTLRPLSGLHRRTREILHLTPLNLAGDFYAGLPSRGAVLAQARKRRLKLQDESFVTIAIHIALTNEMKPPRRVSRRAGSGCS